MLLGEWGMLSIGLPMHSTLSRPKLEYPRIPYHALLRQSAQRAPDRCATIFEGQQLTFREIDGLSNALAHGLLSLGVTKGDRIALFMTNRPEYLISFEAVSKVGAVVTPLNPSYREQ